MSFQELLVSLTACNEARTWANGKTWPEVYATCERGDWLCWLFVRTNPSDLRLLSLVKGHQANLVRHLMTDERSLKAVDTAIAFGEGLATIEQLKAAYATATAATAAATATAAVAVAAAAADAYADAYAATAAATATAAVAVAAAAAADADADADAARVTVRRKCADIVRQYIPIELWNIEK